MQRNQNFQTSEHKRNILSPRPLKLNIKINEINESKISISANIRTIYCRYARSTLDGNIFDVLVTLSMIHFLLLLLNYFMYTSNHF